MASLLKLSHWIDDLTEYFGKASAFSVLLTILVGFYNVIARYAGRFIGIKLTSNLFIELQWYLFSLTFLLGFAYVLKHGANVRVDFLYANWSPKTKAWVDLVGHTIFLITFCIIGIYVTTHPILQSWGHLPDGSYGAWELSPDPDGLPRAPIKSILWVGLGMLLLQTVSEIIKNISIIRNVER
ncbi:MAG: TRAP transporter small permease subunit [Anaerolineales bacterium]|nr:TRAP transporter small permease subunit [Anaerolineales bacterium]